jgi:hypothetical protein
MGLITKTYTPGNIVQSFSDVYLGITAPASSATPTADANMLTLDANGQPTSSTGAHLGSIEGPTSILISEKTNEIMDDQHESAIDLAFVSVEGEVDFTVKELNFARMNTILSSSGLNTRTVLANQDAWQIGGQLANSQYTPFTLLLVAPDRKTAGKFWYALAYKCFLKAPIQTSFSRQKESLYKFKFGMVMDTTRVAGDEFMQWARTK